MLLVILEHIYRGPIPCTADYFYHSLVSPFLRRFRTYLTLALVYYVWFSFPAGFKKLITVLLQLVAGEVTEDTIWGRGALDDKASLMAIMESLEYILARRQQPKRGFFLSFSHDQEVNGDGAVEIVRILKRRCSIKWHDITWHNMTQYDVIWHDITWHNMTSPACKRRWRSRNRQDTQTKVINQMTWCYMT